MADKSKDLVPKLHAQSHGITTIPVQQQTVEAPTTAEVSAPANETYYPVTPRANLNVASTPDVCARPVLLSTTESRPAIKNER